MAQHGVHILNPILIPFLFLSLGFIHIHTYVHVLLPVGIIVGERKMQVIMKRMEDLNETYENYSVLLTTTSKMDCVGFILSLTTILTRELCHFTNHTSYKKLRIS